MAKIAAAIVISGYESSNTHCNRKRNPKKNKPNEKRLAIKAAKIFKLDIAGVDIIRSNKGPLLLEVNSSPGLEGIESITGKDIANEIILAIEKKLKFS